MDPEMDTHLVCDCCQTYSCDCEIIYTEAEIYTCDKFTEHEQYDYCKTHKKRMPV